MKSGANDCLIEASDADDAEIPFDWFFDKILPGVVRLTDYFMTGPARFPKCKRDLMEKTLVDLRDEELYR